MKSAAAVLYTIMIMLVFGMFSLSKTTFCPLRKLNDPGSYCVHACIHVYHIHDIAGLRSYVHAMLRGEKPCIRMHL